MMRKKTIFLTGASGTMGQAGLQALLEKRDQGWEELEIVVLVLPTPRDRKVMAAYAGRPGVKIVWGDLTCYEDVLPCVTRADFVLHVGGMVSPLADYYPQATTRVNLGAIRNILRAIHAQPDPDRVRLVYIGSVAQTGDRNPPLHWGRVGDPINISVYDNYAVTKTIAEREVIESGLAHWVSLRQTGILHPGLFASLDPIMFHQPINGVFEWVTVHDAGRLLANVCADEVPESFWRKIYNIGGGESCRMTNHEFLRRCFPVLGIRDFRTVVEPNWFATRNFHGQWYEDSDDLEQMLHFRRQSVDDFIACLDRQPSFGKSAARMTHPAVIKKWVMEPVASRKNGPLHWIRRHGEDRTAAFFGSREKWSQIPGWDAYELAAPSRQPRRLSHGYDEGKSPADLDIGDMRQAAGFRGGECLSPGMEAGDLHRPLGWRCAFGHTFSGSPFLVLKAGHWCPQCLPPPWNSDAIARCNPFFAQVWCPHHECQEANYYAADVIRDIEKA
jgi:nucleoside-diphosphate-sugar epimerase